MVCRGCLALFSDGDDVSLLYPGEEVSQAGVQEGMTLGRCASCNLRKLHTCVVLDR